MDIRPRISGSEMEWPLLVKFEESDFEQPESASVRQYLKYCRDKRLKITDTYGMLSNGGRLYVDVGDHPEYDTPEDDSFIGSVANEIAGERVMYDIMCRAKDFGLVDDFILTKRVVDDELKTWGYHFSLNSESLLDVKAPALRPLGLHLATINILVGAGAVVPAARNTNVFVTAQKALNLNIDFSASSHDRDQPLISLRNESLSGTRFSRVHVTSLDANMSPWATWMKLGTTSVVLRMMEQGYLKDISYFADDMHTVAQMVACDTHLMRAFPMRDGSKKRAIDVQLDMVERAKLCNKSGGLSQEESHVLDEWERALHDLMSNPELTIDRVEWVARRTVLRRYMGRHGLGFSDPMVAEKDRQWSYIGPLGIASQLRSNLWKKWMPSASSIEQAYLHPPTTTRAFARGALIARHAQSLDTSIMASWDSVQIITENAKERYTMHDPYDSNPTCDEDLSDSQDHDDAAFAEYAADDLSV